MDGTNQKTKPAGQSGVQMAIISNRLENIARKMQNTLFRTARSGVLNTAHDFSCVILTADCELLATAESLPIHTVIGPDLMCKAIKKHHKVFRRGDCFLHNNPYEGNSHAADHCLIVPVVDDEGTLRYFVLAKAHQADCGNAKPTTYMGDVRDVYEEGALIFSAAKIQSDYEDNKDLLRMCELRIRVPEQWWGDYLATLGAVRIGERELLSLGKDVGWDALAQYSEDWFDYSEEKIVQAIRRMPSGKARASSKHDPFPNVPDGIPVNVEIEIDADKGKIIVDLTDNVDCQPCGLNLTEGTAASAAIVGVYNSLGDPGLLLNAGSFRRIEVKLRENCAVGIPRHPFSCSVATTNLADRVTTPVQRAISEIAPGFGMAETGGIMPPAMGVISGRNPRTGTDYVNQVFLGISGGAGTPVTDGYLTIIHPGNAGLCRHDSIEVDELHHPILVRERRILPDTEGAGKMRGAPSLYVEFGPASEMPMDVIYTADGTINPGLGTLGGGAGARAKAEKRDASGAVEVLPACHTAHLTAGEMILSTSAAGGGYGDPFERAIEAVLHDLNEGWISAERAEQVYGVVLRKEKELFVADPEATAARRQRQ